MSKMFTVAGLSTLDGVRKVRVANGLAARIAKLTRTGHTDINLFSLPRAMTKEEAVMWTVANIMNGSAETVVPEAVVEEIVLHAMTLEEALEQIPKREKGRFLARDVRIARAEALMAA